MATVSQTATTLASPAYIWSESLPTEIEASHDENPRNEEDVYPSSRPPLALQNGNSTVHSTTTALDTHSPTYINGESAPDVKPNGLETTHLPQHEHDNPKSPSVKDHAGSAEDLDDAHGGEDGEGVQDVQHKRGSGDIHPNSSDSDENSKWIHRDKLARIESEELQAAGIFLPRQRDRARSKSQNRPRRDPSQDKVNGSARSIGGSEYTVSRSRKNSAATSTDTKTLEVSPIPSWDLRLPEEILEEGDGYRASSSSGKSSSRIPVAKISGVPIPSEHLARDTRLARKRDGSPGEEDSITYPRTRARSGSTGNALAKATNTGTVPQPNKRADSATKKPGAATTTTTNRKPKPATGAAGRPKTRGGPSKDSTSSGAGTTRPSTRSGEREFSSSNSKPMEGEPPWMVSAYRPDPRLPPDQQLLPTVAKRLQQEKWEREGKFGSVYDKEFRPLTDVGFLQPPEPSTAPDKQAEEEAEKDGQKEEGGDWPLKPEAKSPTMPGRSNSYSTMPKIADRSTMGSIPSPRAPGQQQQQQQQQPEQPVKVPEPLEEETEKKAGCGCCIVM